MPFKEFAQDHMEYTFTDVLSPEEKEKFIYEAKPEELDILPTGEVYMNQLLYRKKLTEVVGLGNWKLIPLSPYYEDEKIGRQSWALCIREQIIAYAWGEKEFFNTDKPSFNTFSSPEICKSNALMRVCKDLLIGWNCWDKDFCEMFQREYCERWNDKWRLKKNSKGNVVENKPLKISPKGESTPILPNVPLVGTLVSASGVGEGGNKSARALFRVGEEEVSTSFFTIPDVDIDELKSWIGRKCEFTYVLDKKTGKYKNLISVSSKEGASADLQEARDAVKKTVEQYAVDKDLETIDVWQRFGKMTEKDLYDIAECSSIIYTLESE